MSTNLNQDYQYSLNSGDNSRYMNTGILDNRFRAFYSFTPPVYTAIDKVQDEEFIITPETEFRLDKISYIFFETSKLWWMLAQYNKEYDIRYYAAGVKIKIPSSSSVAKLGQN